jgi:hypothetical protein
MSQKRQWTWWGEFSGAVGDLGILLPLASALAISGGIGIGRLIFLWGVVYVATGLWYRVPVSVQPLKAMAVLAIAQGIDATTLSNAAVGYGLLFCILAMTGTVERIRRFFSPGLVRGVQLGIGLFLVRKAWMLASESDWFLGSEGTSGMLAPGVAILILAVIVAARHFLRWNLTLPVIGSAVAAGAIFGPPVLAGGSAVVQPQWPAPSSCSCSRNCRSRWAMRSLPRTMRATSTGPTARAASVRRVSRPRLVSGISVSDFSAASRCATVRAASPPTIGSAGVPGGRRSSSGRP